MTPFWCNDSRLGPRHFIGSIVVIAAMIVAFAVITPKAGLGWLAVALLAIFFFGGAALGRWGVWLSVVGLVAFGIWAELVSRHPLSVGQFALGAVAEALIGGGAAFAGDIVFNRIRPSPNRTG